MPSKGMSREGMTFPLKGSPKRVVSWADDILIIAENGVAGGEDGTTGFDGDGIGAKRGGYNTRALLCTFHVGSFSPTEIQCDLGESITSMCHKTSPFNMILVASCSDYSPMRRLALRPRIRSCVYDSEKKSLVFLDKFIVGDTSECPPLLAMCNYHDNYFLAGRGGDLLLLSVTERGEFIKVYEARNICDRIVALDHDDSFIFIGCASRGVLCVEYDPQHMFHNLTVSEIRRSVTAMRAIGKGFVASADKFGNFYFERMPPVAMKPFLQISVDGMEDVSKSIRIPTLQLCSQAFVGDIATQMVVGDIFPAPFAQAQEEMETESEQDRIANSVVYCTILGSVGEFSVVLDEEDIILLIRLQNVLLEMYPTLSGQSHVDFQGQYHEPMGVLDGDLCRLYFNLPANEKELIAQKMDLPVRSIRHLLLRHMAWASADEDGEELHREGENGNGTGDGIEDEDAGEETGEGDGAVQGEMMEVE
eukprot:TRINITY_DN219_c0_g1_i5.p1 TRINITY_DN219_c0_g1~~TRINITY_DN219_c0_g1_i5.p1  ORF type:complete len:541 (-),score=174.74 TRINITY_DN219_c0_g1_i5:464-1894(-)